MRILHLGIASFFIAMSTASGIAFILGDMFGIAIGSDKAMKMAVVYGVVAAANYLATIAWQRVMK